MLASGVPERGSSRTTRPAASLATQTEPAPAASADGRACTSIGRPALPLCDVDPHHGGVDRGGDPDRAVAERDGVRCVADVDPLHDLVGLRRDLGDRAALAVGDPQRPRAERDAGRFAADVDRHDLVALAVDPRHGPVELVRHPHRAGARRHRLRPVPDRVLGRDPAAVPLDEPDRVLVDGVESVRLEHADGAERGPGEQQRGGDEEEEHARAETGGARRCRHGRRRAAAGALSAGRSSAGSCARICSCSRRSSPPGSTPI